MGDVIDIKIAKKIVSIEDLITNKIGFYDPKICIKIAKGGHKIEINYKSASTIETIIKHLYPNQIKLSVFSNVIWFNGKPLEDNVKSIIAKRIEQLERHYEISPELVKRMIEDIAQENKFNEIKDYLDSLEVKPTNHLENIIGEIIELEPTANQQIIAISKAYVKRFLLSAVARAMEPGAHVAFSLILASKKQETGKSAFFKFLNPKEEWSCSAKIDFSNNQLAANTYLGRWIIEFAELAQFKKISTEEIKTFLTQNQWDYVQKFKTCSTKLGKMCVFGGTTNDENMLVDDENRRFGVINIKMIDWQKLIEVRDELWSEVYQLYLSGEDWNLTPEEKQVQLDSNKFREIEKPEVDKVIEYILEKYKDNPNVYLNTFRIIEDCSSSFGLRINKYHVAEAFSATGFIKKRIKIGGEWKKVFGHKDWYSGEGEKIL
jgi:predicted P-loop ATPase